MIFTIYVAEPIDQAWGSGPPEWKPPDEWTLFRPSRAFSGAHGANLEAVNRAVLATVHGLLAFLPRGIPTIGVPAEIEYAVSHHIPTAIVSDLTESVALRGFADRGAIVHSDVDEAVELLRLEVQAAPSLDEISFVKVDDRATLAEADRNPQPVARRPRPPGAAGIERVHVAEREQVHEVRRSGDLAARLHGSGDRVQWGESTGERLGGRDRARVRAGPDGLLTQPQCVHLVAPLRVRCHVLVELDA